MQLEVSRLDFEENPDQQFLILLSSAHQKKMKITRDEREIT